MTLESRIKRLQDWYSGLSTNNKTPDYALKELPPKLDLDRKVQLAQTRREILKKIPILAGAAAIGGITIHGIDMASATPSTGQIANGGLWQEEAPISQILFAAQGGYWSKDGDTGKTILQHATDAGIALNNAIALLPTLATTLHAGGRILMKVGGYDIFTTVLVPNYVRIEGEGGVQGNQLNLKADVDMFQFGVPAGVSQDIPGFARLTNLYLNGNSATRSAGIGVHGLGNGSGLSDCTVDHCWIDSFKNDAIKNDFYFYHRYLNNWLEGNGGAAINQSGGFCWSINNVLQSSQYGFLNPGTAGDSQKIIGNEVRLNTGDGIRLVTHGKNSHITNNEFLSNGSGTGQYDLKLDSLFGSVNVSNNQFWTSGSILRCIYLWGATNQVFNNNYFETGTAGGFAGCIFLAGGGAVGLKIYGNAGSQFPIGIFANPFGTAVLGMGGSAATPTASTDYIVTGFDVHITAADSSNANNAILVKDPAGTTVLGPVSTLSFLYVPNGFKINWGAFTGTPGAVSLWAHG